MGYAILFGIVAILTAGLAAWVRVKFGGGVAIVLGAVLSVLAVVLFFANKSDSVADTILETIADMSPPLVTLAMVAGWWLGVVLARAVQGPGR
jgi:hypothetical protein